MDILAKLNVKSDAQFDGNLTVGTDDIPSLNINTDSVNINTLSLINATSEFFLGSGASATSNAFTFISSSVGYTGGSITKVNTDNSVACRLDCTTTLTGNTINSNALVIHSVNAGTLFESDILFKSNNFIEFDIGQTQSENFTGHSGHIDFNLFNAINNASTSLSSAQTDIFTVYGRGVDHNGELLKTDELVTEFEKDSVKLISAGYSITEFISGAGSGRYTGNYIRFQLSNNKPTTGSSCINYNESQYVFTDQGIYISSQKSTSVPVGQYQACHYNFIKINGKSLFDGILPTQKQFTNVEIPASCQLVNFGNIGPTEFKMIPPMMQLTDDENNIIHANIQFKQDACAIRGYNLMVGIEHDDVIPAGKYKLNVFGN